MTRTGTRICISIILFVVVFALWVLARLNSRIKTLFFSSFAAFIFVWICLINWWVGGIKAIESLYIDEAILVPGFAAARLIASQVDKIDKIAYLSNFEGPFFTIVMFFSSFVFYTAVIFVAVKVVSYLKKRLLLRKANGPKVTESFEER